MICHKAPETGGRFLNPLQSLPERVLPPCAASAGGSRCLSPQQANPSSGKLNFCLVPPQGPWNIVLKMYQGKILPSVLKIFFFLRLKKHFQGLSHSPKTCSCSQVPGEARGPPSIQLPDLAHQWAGGPCPPTYNVALDVTARHWHSGHEGEERRHSSSLFPASRLGREQVTEFSLFSIIHSTGC